MKNQEITVEVNAKLTIDKKTADICLRLAELYANEAGMIIIGNKNPGCKEMEYTYEPVI